MKVTVALFLVLTVLLSTTSRSIVPGVLDFALDSHKYVCSPTERSALPDLDFPVLSVVTLPGLSLSTSKIYLPSLVSEDWKAHSNWQVASSFVSVDTVPTRREFFSPVYMGSTLLVAITFTSLALFVAFTILTCVWFVCSSLISSFVGASYDSGYTSNTQPICPTPQSEFDISASELRY